MLVATVPTLTLMQCSFAETVYVMAVFRLMNGQIHVQTTDRFDQVVKDFFAFLFYGYYGDLLMHSLVRSIYSCLLHQAVITPKMLSMICSPASRTENPSSGCDRPPGELRAAASLCRQPSLPLAALLRTYHAGIPLLPVVIRVTVDVRHPADVIH
jgi:hypothetical protein